MAELSIALLGSYQVLQAEESISAFESNKVRALLAFLAVEADQPHSRHALASMFWPEQTERRARRNLAQALYNLRQVLGDQPEAATRFLDISQHAIQFRGSDDVWLDVLKFSDLLAACEVHQHESLLVCPSCISRLEEAAALYQGDFLEGFSPGIGTTFEEWALLRREQYLRSLLDVLSTLVNAFKQQGQPEKALLYAWRQVELDPWREEGQQQLMWLLALSGRRNEALSQYEKHRRLLLHELGVEPVAETQALADAIRRGKIRSTTQNNLPLPTTPFVGRQRELKEINDLLAKRDIRLVSIVGLGGIGKTRLALAAARQLAAMEPDTAARFPDGVYFVNLSALEEAAHILAAFIHTLSTSFPRDDTSEQRTKQHLLDFLRPKRLLLLMDNVEDSEGVAELVAEILQEAPEVKVLATSRERLHLQQEHVYALQGLACPAAGSALELQKFATVQLFTQTARRIQPGFDPAGQDDLSCLAQICERLEGMPLAIELAAAWVNTLSLHDILSEISHSIDFLAVETRNIPDRHRSLRAVFEATWQRLNAAQKRAMEKSSVFEGGFTRLAAREIIGADARLMASLVSKSLLQYNVSRDRYEVHDLLRQYAAAMLSRSEARRLRKMHLAHFAAFAEAAESKLFGIEQITFLDKLSDDYANLRAALQWAVDNRGCNAAGLRLAGSLRRFWVIRDHLVEGREWLLLLVQNADPQENPLAYAKAMYAAGSIETHLCENEQARAHFQQALAVYAAQEELAGKISCCIKLGRLSRLERDWPAAEAFYLESQELAWVLGDQQGVAEAAHGLAKVAAAQGKLLESADIHRQNLQLRRELGDQLRLTKTLTSLGALAMEAHDPQAAHSFFQEALDIFEAADYRVGVASTLNLFGELARYEGDYWLAADYYEKSMAVQYQLGNKLGMNDSKMCLGRTMLWLGDHRQAKRLLQEGLKTSHQYRDEEGAVLCMEALAGLAQIYEQYELAARLFSAAKSWRQRVNMPPEIADRVENDSILESLRGRMTVEDLNKAWQMGQEMAVDEAIVYALTRI